jgi:PAS domain S-box-containing protein
MTISHTRSKLPSSEGEGLLQDLLLEQQSALEAMPHHVWISPPDSSTIVYFNRRWYEYTGLGKREALRDSGASTIHPDDLELVISSGATARLFSRAFSVDARMRGRNGVYRWFRIRGAPTFSGDKVIAWVGTNTDIDESRKMRDELEAAHARLARVQAITAMLATALTLADVTGIFVREVVPFLNAHSGMLALVEAEGNRLKTLEHSGYEPIQSLIKQRSTVVNLEDPWPVCACFKQVKPMLFESRNAFMLAYPNLIEALKHSGVQAVANLPLISEAQAIGVMNLNFDQPTVFEPERIEFMTTIASLIAQALDRARLYDAQREQAEVLERRVQERTRELELHKEELEAFVYTVSHDLRAPLHKLSMTGGLLNTAIAANQKEDVNWLVEGIETGVRRMDQLIRDLLHLSRAGRTPEDAILVNLGETVERVIGELEPTIQARNVLVRRPESWPQVTYPQTELYQIVLNLLGNAVRFADQTSSPEVQVAWTLEDSNIVVCVEDNGAGIPETQRGKVFELFAKLDPSSSGTGVGLAIVKRIAERHGGGVEVDQSPLGGARFRVTIPYKTET